MIDRPDVACLRRACVPFLVLVLLAGGTALAAARGALTPLTGRPEDPDPSRVYDQNDLMASASSDGKLVLFTSRRSGEFRQYVMHVDGSNVRAITKGPGSQMQGSWSPDGKRIAYVQRGGGNGQPRYQHLVVSNADGSEPKVVAENPGRWPIASWAPDGGHLLYHGPGPNGSEDIWRVDVETGEREVVLGSAAADLHPSLSPDGRRLVFLSKRDGDDYEIYVTDLRAGGPWKQLTHNDVNDFTPSWSPDGEKIVYQSPRGGKWTIFTINPDGTEETAVTRYPAQYDPVWSADGSEIFFNSDRDGRRGIYVMNADGSNQRKLTNTEPSTFVTVARDDDVEEAVRLFREARKKDPDAAYFYEEEVQYLGENYLEIGDLRRAALLFEVNVEAFPESKAAQVHLGDAHLAAGEPRLAAKCYERAMEIDPDDAAVARMLERLHAPTAAPSGP